MKKMIAILLTLIMGLGCAASLAETKELYPFHRLDTSTYGNTDSVVHATINPAAIEEDQLLVFDVYDYDTYAVTDILSLQPGDRIFANELLQTVNTVEKVEGGFEINGGFFNEEEEGITLVYDPENPEQLYSMLYDGMLSATMLGQAAYPFADQVTVVTFRWDEDGDFSGQYDTVTLAADEAATYLLKLTEPAEPDGYGFAFNQNETTVTLEDGKVTRIFSDWSPSV